MPDDPLRILALESSDPDFALLRQALARQGVTADWGHARDERSLRDALAHGPWDALIADRVPAGLTPELARTLASRGGVPLVIGLPPCESPAAPPYLGPALLGAVQTVRAGRERAEALCALRASQARLQELASHLQTRIDDERTAIAREIHDDVGGTLTALRFDLQWIRRNGGAPVAARVDEALEALDHAILASQRIMRNLRPPVLDAGVVAALEWHVEQFGRRSGLAARFSSNRERVDAAPEIAMTVFRVAQEALTNVAKHAQATEVAVDLIEDDGLVSLEVSDNGRGFSAGDLAKPASFGLRGLAERARAAGGWLDVSSASGRTTILLTVPATEDAASRIRDDAREVRTGARPLRIDGATQ